MSFFSFISDLNPWISDVMDGVAAFRCDFDCVLAAKSVAWLVASDVGSSGPFSGPLTSANDSPFFRGDWESAYTDVICRICDAEKNTSEVAAHLGLIYRDSICRLAGTKHELKQIMGFMGKARCRADAFFPLSLSFFWQIAMARAGSSRSILDSFSGRLALMDALKDDFMPTYVSTAKEIQTTFRS